MLLGNGDIGLCLTVRPDALGFHIGKSDSWDIHVSEDHEAHVLTFPELLKLWYRANGEAAGPSRDDHLEEKIPILRDYTQTIAGTP